MLEKEGPNDGLVSLQSAKWVRVLIFVHALTVCRVVPVLTFEC